jgi:hypothetical protein
MDTSTSLDIFEEYCQIPPEESVSDPFWGCDFDFSVSEFQTLEEYGFPTIDSNPGESSVLEDLGASPWLELEYHLEEPCISNTNEPSVCSSFGMQATLSY